MAPIIGDPDEVISAVAHAARSEANRLEQDAERQVARIDQEAEARASGIRGGVLDDARARAEEVRRRRRVRAGQEHKRQLLRVREQLLDEVWQRAESRLRSLRDRDDDYAAALERLTGLATSALGAGTRIVAADRRGQSLLTDERLRRWGEACSRRLGQPVTLERSDHPHEDWGGVVVSAAEDRRRVDATFSTRLSLAREELRAELLRKLVGP